MDDGRRGDVMPLELAMKRESAYRKKVEMMLSQLYGGESREDPFSSQVPSSSPSSGPSLSGTKRKTPTRSSQCLPPQQLQLLYSSHTLGNRKEDLFCKVCQVACPSSFHLKQHLIGQKHKDTLDLKSGRNIREEDANTRKWCDLCKIWCINKYSLEQHFKGKKHQDNVQELELGGKEGQRKTNQVKLYCELCKLWCMDEYAFNQHLKGKKHILNLHAFEEKRTAKGKGLAVDQSSTRKN
ncbi:zinc finger RNA-binding protein-like [Vitis riparia]|uniref:zinc finger RNA-binding protein-like n=1 Tax=Vitis riparia TaxID=96939 RepID=UPI00155B2627|nr:zinc finger RNA-binding protein-like [Vitis riparia]XP_034672945.1 zinc finger RNA-binding protein-like [Vitis riparia]XP_034672946.1 zinc finger RNA-binding protein-like [Vitis riparia]XP_034672947.1 zinc finger RNA-binding protein-like [Vitis riparia]